MARRKPAGASNSRNAELSRSSFQESSATGRLFFVISIHPIACPGRTMTAKIFIDGESGTTGLGIRARLEAYPKIELLSLPADQRKIRLPSKQQWNKLILLFFAFQTRLPRSRCDRGRAGDRSPRILDASTAHRVAEGWTYGFPELAPARPNDCKRKACCQPRLLRDRPIALLRRCRQGLLPAEHPVSIHAVSGYSAAAKR